MKRLLQVLARTKLYWGLAILFAAGVAFSPVTSKGHNIFLSSGNLSDVLRQVSVTGLVAVGMTMVILTGGIDLSVGSTLAFGSVITASLLTQSGWTTSAAIAMPLATVTAFVVVAASVRFFVASAANEQGVAGQNLGPAAIWGAPLLGLLAAVLVGTWLLPREGTKYGVIAVLVAVPCVGLAVGALNGLVIVIGRLQPFIVTLAAMVTLLGLARLTAGQDSAVIAVYSGTNATADVDGLRALLWGILPVPGLFFLGALVIFTLVLRFTVFGRYLYALGGNEEATRLSGIAVMPVKVATYAFSGLLAALASVLYVAQYRQGKPDAGAGLELDAIAAVVIGGTSLMGGQGSLAGTLVGVLIFGMLTNILELHNITTNVQLVLKGLIIVVTVLLQERNLGELLAPLRRSVGRAVARDKTAPGGVTRTIKEETT